MGGSVPGIEPARAWRARFTVQWIKAALRRPLRGLLVTAGLLMMTVATVGALVAGDSLERLFLADVHAQFGAVDLIVRRPGDAPISESLARITAVEAGSRPAASAGRLVLDAVATSGTLGEPDAQVLGLSPEENALTSPLRGRGHVDVTTLGPEQVVVNRRLAERLDVDVGHDLRLVIATPEWVEQAGAAGLVTHQPEARAWHPTIAGVADDDSVADDGRKPNVLARLDSVQRVTGMRGVVSGLYVAARAPGRDEAKAVARAFEDFNRVGGLVNVPVKEDALDIARDEGGLFRGILVTLALLVVAAACAVTANLIVLLGQDRAQDVALLRTMGVRRRTIRRLMTWEASVYALPATIAGTLTAIPIAERLARALADHFASISAGRGREQVELVLDARPGTIAIAAVLVVTIASATAWAASRRIANLDVESILRGLAPRSQDETGPTRRPLVVAATGLFLLGTGLTARDAGDLLRFAGLTLLLTAWWMRRRRGARDVGARSRLDTRVAAAGLAWFVLAPVLLGNFSRGIQSGFGLLAVAGAGAVACATVLISWRLDAVMRLVRMELPGRRLQAPLRTAGAYARSNRLRSGTVIASVAIVLFMVAALTVLGSATDIADARQGGGFNVVGTAPVPLDVPAIEASRGVASVLTLDHTSLDESWFRVIDEDDNEHGVPYPVRAIEATTTFAIGQRFGLADALDEYATSTHALEAVVRGAGVVLDRYSRPEGARPGDDVVIDDGRGPRAFELLAVLDTFVLQAVLMGPDDYAGLFRSRGPTFVLAQTNGATPDDAAMGLMATGAARGLEARTIANAADEVTRINRAFTDVFARMLQFGLLVALAAVGVLAARATRERRQQIAVLRMLGFRRVGVGITLLSEPLLQVAVGCALGIGVGLGVLRLLFAAGFHDLAFLVDWAEIGAGSAGVVGGALIVAVGPAVAGARRRPGDDVRDLG